MADPVIVPPPPVINQGADLSGASGDTSPGLDVLQKVFDRVLPEVKTSPSTPKATESPSAPVSPPDQAVQPPPEVKPPDIEHKLPSFLEDALKVEDERQVKPPAAQPEEEWSEELPKEERQTRIKGLRDAYKKLKEEVTTLKARPYQDEQTTARLEVLQKQNKEMSTALAQMGVSQNAEFQEKIINPLYAAWNEAARIVKESGHDPQELQRAMSKSGKQQFEALDEIFEGMPESAKMEANEALRVYRRYEVARQNALKNAPQTFEVLRKKELDRQFQVLSAQQEDMKNRFDGALKRLREEAKLEVLQRSNDPNTQWWNDQADKIENNSRSLYLENTDMDKMAVACILAPAVDAYRKLWLSERAARMKSEGTLKDRFGVEPSLSESSGPGNGAEPLKDDLKKPFADVFLREFHKAQARSR